VHSLKSYFAKNLLELDHTIGPIEETIDIIHTTGKVRILNLIAKYYIYKAIAHNNQLNERLTVTPKAIFDTLLRNVDTQRSVLEPFHFTYWHKAEKRGCFTWLHRFLWRILSLFFRCTIMFVLPGSVHTSRPP
jgi:hypothetical protein